MQFKLPLKAYNKQQFCWPFAKIQLLCNSIISHLVQLCNYKPGINIFVEKLQLKYANG